MNKQQFIKAFSDESGLTQKDAGTAFDAMVRVIVNALKEEDKIQIAGFGTYELRKKAAREGINPLTKKKVKIAACNCPVFKFGNSFKEIFNQDNKKK